MTNQEIVGRLFTVKSTISRISWTNIQGSIHSFSGPLIYDGAGGDCSSVWESYHPLSLTEKGPFEKYCIGKVADYKDFYSYSGDFYSTLKRKVEAAIPSSKRQSDWRLYSKGIVIVIGYVYSLFLYMTECSWLSVLLLALFSSQVGVNIMHDGNHMAYSSNKKFSLMAGYMLDILGSTSVVYRRSHNFGHHGCVNHYELDRAFDTTYPLFRLHPFQKHLWYHKYQHYYAALLYGMVNFGDAFGTFDEMYWMSNPPTRFGFLSKFDFWFQVCVKLNFLITILLVPIWNFGLVHMFPKFMVYFMLFSYGYALFFAVNHWTDEAQQVDNSSVTKSNWGVLQVENSINFGLKSSFWTNASGGLNHQIEHHLFPGYSHTRLPEIAPIVQEECLKRGIRYFQYANFWEALRGHFQQLKNLSK